MILTIRKYKNKSYISLHPEIESTSIKRARSNSQDRRTSSNWNAIVTVDLEESSLMPEVVLCGVGQAKMEPIDLYPSDSGILNYQVCTTK